MSALVEEQSAIIGFNTSVRAASDPMDVMLRIIDAIPDHVGVKDDQGVLSNEYLDIEGFEQNRARFHVAGLAHMACSKWNKVSMLSLDADAQNVEFERVEGLESEILDRVRALPVEGASQALIDLYREVEQAFQEALGRPSDFQSQYDFSLTLALQTRYSQNVNTGKILDGPVLELGTLFKGMDNDT